MERYRYHVGDVANLCAGAAFAFGNTQGMRLNERLFGHRFLRTLDAVESEWQQIVEIILGNGIFMDRAERPAGTCPMRHTAPSGSRYLATGPATSLTLDAGSPSGVPACPGMHFGIDLVASPRHAGMLLDLLPVQLNDHGVVSARLGKL